MATLTLWRHPKPRGAEGRCIGSRTDLPVDPRKAKRLAHRIRAHARQHKLAREVVTSPLRRSADVGRWLKRWGFRWHIDAALTEVDFGSWDGRVWSDIPASEFDRWMANFVGFDFGGGEPLSQLIERTHAWRQPVNCVLAVGHAGWVSAWLWRSGEVPAPGTWPAPLPYAANVFGDF